MSNAKEDLAFQNEYYKRYASRYYEKPESQITQEELQYVKTHIRTVKQKIRQKRKSK